ncbi:MAG: metallophosphoesterase [Bacteroidales bacterium]|nr:metallophosphoesterase [Bacteroidales bacterium]
MSELTHNIIGDIHGRDIWKQLVDNRLSNVFVGDFFDPFSPELEFEACKDNFLAIIDYKRQHPSTVLLWGNHELHYLLYGESDEEIYSRFCYAHAEEIKALLLSNAPYFDGVAYAIDNRYLVTHAGVSRYWYMRWIDNYNGQDPNTVARQINNLWNLNRKAFSVRGNYLCGMDASGLTQSPLWMRPSLLEKYNLFQGCQYYQVFGHTQCGGIYDENGLICVDCLRMAKYGFDLQYLTLKI